MSPPIQRRIRLARARPEYLGAHVVHIAAVPDATVDSVIDTAGSPLPPQAGELPRHRSRRPAPTPPQG